MKKILVANRGEIALRIMRTLKEMEITSVAIYSEADRLSPHVRYADEAYCVGPAPSSESYLRGEKIIQIARDCGAEGIHPGYGFLSENAAFSAAVQEAGLIFIGPNPDSIKVMGDKLSSKQTVADYGIPLVPGTKHAITDTEEAKKIAAEIGFPVLIKASAGGGGKGMRIVHSAEDLEEQMNRAVSEAISAFGNGAVFIEKYITSPKHIEIQVLADTHGNVVHLFERECSVQRRHQKVVEEAPSAVIDEKLRSEIGASAVDVARSCNYVGAGTVEFIFDENRNYYFLEMNTRLQVEHPVTELITGIDLVRQQVEIARGNALPFKQEDLKWRGHAIELRVYAEDPDNKFLPDVGKLETYCLPQGPGIRVDDGFEEGMDIPIYYDPMISKLCTYGEDREEAIGRMIRAIDEYRITGVKNTLAFGRFVMQHEAFRDGSFDTHFVENFFDGLSQEEISDGDDIILSALAAHVWEKKSQSLNSGEIQVSVSGKNAWKSNRT